MWKIKHWPIFSIFHPKDPAKQSNREKNTAFLGENMGDVLFSVYYTLPNTKNMGIPNMGQQLSVKHGNPPTRPVLSSVNSQLVFLFLGGESPPVSVKFRMGNTLPKTNSKRPWK